MIYRKVEVTKIISNTDECFELETTVVDEYNGGNAKVLCNGHILKVMAYKSIIDTVKIGDSLLVEASAVAKKLGTGGLAFAVTNFDADFTDKMPEIGHIVKARYSPFQHMVMSIEEQDSPYHDVIKSKSSIEGLPVIVADLHSALPSVLAGIYASDPKAKVVYVMPDGAGLPIAFSKNVAVLKEKNWIYKTITCGQAYGGDGETINIYTALLAAKYVYNADVVIVTQGPGNAGTGTHFGFSGMQCADIFNAIGVLKGTPIGVLRLSNGDLRERHYGVSHHCLTTICEATYVPVHLPIPTFDGENKFEKELGKDFYNLCIKKIEKALITSLSKHSLVPFASKSIYEDLCNVPVKLSTMGRNLEQDYSAFAAGYASGFFAMTLK
ncbi:DUF3866 family protein [Actinomyces sp. zg-332]|uniref:DUF3866 family protein n=1 Tax=Actinomyces sp. zg-332 TaxID=2708340 RepID=UPI00141EB97E|nr:DUF3866 family protein [Actinomyces sp. zg-332]QPK93680.1 DUF3866 family protein [Actinomyces sp. zg-332]